MSKFVDSRLGKAADFVCVVLTVPLLLVLLTSPVFLGVGTNIVRDVWILCFWLTLVWSGGAMLACILCRFFYDLVK